jgi:shikimate dehydrogenase
MGWPVAHSRSPLIHGHWIAEHGLRGAYVPLAVQPAQLEQALRALPVIGFAGCNLTIPHKFEALKICTELDDTARLLGAVNTLLFDGQRIVGFNTDGQGLVRAVRDVFGTDLRDLRVMILGAGGGAGTAAALQCALEKCPRIVLVNRTVEKARDVAARAKQFLHSDRLEGPDDPVTVIAFEQNALREQLSRIDLVINASSLGMKRSDPPLIPAALLTPDLTVYDMIYRPAVTRLLEDAQEAGARTANGLSMLLHQGALSLEIWTNRPAPIDAMRSGLAKAAA